MVTFREFVHAFREVGLNSDQPIIVHASLSAVGEIRGGVETVIGALLSIVPGIMAPTFTYNTMIIPEVGPANNAMQYGAAINHNRLAEFFQPDLPADRLMGVLPEAIRTHPNARRSDHPITSFSGINLKDALDAQTIEEPLAPIGALARQNGMVLLIGVDHTSNTSIHYAERLAGRKQFIRWALTPQGVRECPRYSGCSMGFEQAAPILEPFTRTGQVGQARIRAVGLLPMLDLLTDLICRQPDALLCDRGDDRCTAVRQALENPGTPENVTSNELIGRPD